MATTFSWDLGPLVVDLQSDGLTDVVKIVNWRLVAEDEPYSASVYGTIPVPAPNPSAFTPYPDLQESQVQAWVIEALGPEYVATLKAGLVKQIDLQRNPVEAVLPAPWSA